MIKSPNTFLIFENVFFFNTSYKETKFMMKLPLHHFLLSFNNCITMTVFQFIQIIVTALVSSVLSRSLSPCLLFLSFVLLCFSNLGSSKEMETALEDAC